MNWRDLEVKKTVLILQPAILKVYAPAKIAVPKNWLVVFSVDGGKTQLIEGMCEFNEYFEIISSEKCVSGEKSTEKKQQ